MALVTYISPGVYDDHIGSATINAGTNVSITTGITSAGTTAPNLTNKITGCWIYINSMPASGTMTVAVLESGVSKATVSANISDLKLGFNYFRFTTPYQFATLTASAYTARVTTSLNTGNLRIAASGLWFQFTYDTARALGATDDIWIGGFNNAGITPQTLTASGTSMSFGSGKTGITLQINATMDDFMALPAQLRVRFDHDPVKLVEFLENDQNRSEAIQLGLIDGQLVVEPIVSTETPKAAE